MKITLEKISTHEEPEIKITIEETKSGVVVKANKEPILITWSFPKSKTGYYEETTNYGVRLK